jgi:hypothetical protein
VSHQRNILTSHDSTSYHKMFDATPISLSAFSNGLPQSMLMAKLSAPIVVSVNYHVNTRGERRRGKTRGGAGGRR